MSVCGNDVISPNEYDTTPPPDIDTIPRTPAQYYSISDLYQPYQGPSRPSKNNSSP